MFKKLFAVLVALVMLCACSAEEPEVPVVPEEPDFTETEEQKSSLPEEETETEEKNEKTLAFDIRYSEKHEEYMNAVNIRIESYKAGTFEEMENHHSGYPEDFPDVKNLLPADEGNTALAYKNTEKLSENSWSDGEIDYVYFIDDYHAIILEPVELVLFDGTISLTFANTGYMSAISAGYENIWEWFLNRYDGFYAEELKIAEPELIAEHIAALNEVFKETFFTDLDWNVETYSRLFKTEQTNGTTPDAVPDKMIKTSELGNGIPEGYYPDAGEAECYLVEKYKSKKEICKKLGKWLSEEIFSTALDDNMLEYSGKLYIVRGGRGYGVGSCSGFTITEQTETEIKATGNYFMHGCPNGTIDLLFSVKDGKILLEYYLINYAD